jgi:hypothetical protein
LIDPPGNNKIADVIAEVEVIVPLLAEVLHGRDRHAVSAFDLARVRIPDK